MKFDRKGKRAQWTKARAAEGRYTTQLLSVARQVGTIVRTLAPGGELENLGGLLKALTDYARIIEPWAESIASYMIADVARRDEAMWRKNADILGRAVRLELKQAPSGQVFRQLEAEQVELITSIPLEAAERVQELATGSIYTGARAKELAAEIMRTEAVTKSRATLIARTETSRAASNFVQARAQLAGSEGYIWRTSGDADVRDSHAAMEGKYVRWSSPPTLDKMVGHAGCLPNCRCYAEPIFPDL